MRKTMITYSLSGKKNALKITRKIYGYIDSSNHGRYKYERKGILSDIPYEKISRTTILLDKKNKEKVINELKKLGLKVKVFDIIIENAD